jgi:hypothetical protein
MVLHGSTPHASCDEGPEGAGTTPLADDPLGRITEEMIDAKDANVATDLPPKKEINGPVRTFKEKLIDRCLTMQFFVRIETH